MELSEKVENIGGAGGYASGGWNGIFVLAIFFIMLLVLCRGREGDRREDSCADKLTWARYANFVDPELTRNHIDQCRDTGQIRKDLAVDNGNVLCAIDKQTGEMLLNQEKTTNAILMGQNVIAREQERYFFQAQIDQKNEKLAEHREKAIMLEGRLLQTEAERAADRRQAELFTAMNNQFCILNNRVTGIEGSMIKAPAFYPYGGIASVNMCGYNPCGGYATAASGCGSCA